MSDTNQAFNDPMLQVAAVKKDDSGSWDDSQTQASTQTATVNNVNDSGFWSFPPFQYDQVDLSTNKDTGTPEVVVPAAPSLDTDYSKIIMDDDLIPESKTDVGGLQQNNESESGISEWLVFPDLSTWNMNADNSSKNDTMSDPILDSESKVTEVPAVLDQNQKLDDLIDQSKDSWSLDLNFENQQMQPEAIPVQSNNVDDTMNLDLDKANDSEVSFQDNSVPNNNVVSQEAPTVEEFTPKTFDLPMQESTSTVAIDDSSVATSNGLTDEAKNKVEEEIVSSVPEVEKKEANNVATDIAEEKKDDADSLGVDLDTEVTSVIPVQNNSIDTNDDSHKSSHDGISELFHKTHGLVQDLFKVQRTQFDSEVSVIWMQSDVSKVEYVFSLTIADGDWFAVTKKTTNQDWEVIADTIAFVYNDDNQKFVVRVDDKNAYEEVENKTDDAEVQHYVTDKLNKFWVLIESNIKKIKKEREQEKKDKADKKRLVGILRDF